MAYHTCFMIFKSMGVDNHGKEFVQKAAMFVSANILRHRKQKISNVVMLTKGLACTEQG